MAFIRAGHFRYFGTFSKIKYDFSAFLYQVISAPVLFKKPPPSQMNLIINAKNHFCYWKIQKYLKCPALGHSWVQWHVIMTKNSFRFLKLFEKTLVMFFYFFVPCLLRKYKSKNKKQIMTKNMTNVAGWQCRLQVVVNI